MVAPKGVKYINNPNTIETQLFPEEYFSGSDITIYFGDVFVSEVSAIEFVLQEKVLPIYGYASKTYDAVARGNRIVQGSFRIPFREAGYMSTILTHLGQLYADSGTAAPTLAYKLGAMDDKVPSWNADVKETIEDLINSRSLSDMFSGKYPIGPGHKGSHVKEVRRLLTKVMPNDPWGTDNEYTNWLKSNGGVTLDNCQALSDKLFGNDKLGNPNTEAIKKMQSRISWLLHGRPVDKRRYATQYDADGKALMPLVADGIIDYRTSKGMELFLTLFKYNDALKVLTDSKDTSSQYKGQFIYKRMPPFALYALANPTLSGYEDYYGTDIYTCVMNWQAAKGRPVTGELTEDDLKALCADAGEKYENEEGQMPNIEKDFADYEKEIWGRSFSADLDHKYQTFFYTDRIQKDGIDLQESLKKKGFDIYITYGPSPEAVKANGNNIPQYFEFNNTVKAIRAVQLTSTGQTIMANGQPIEEVYTFLAKDLD